MTPRLLLLCLLLPVVLLPTGCASTPDSTADDAASWQSTPEKPQDDHGWGANVGNVGGR